MSSLMVQYDVSGHLGHMHFSVLTYPLRHVLSDGQIIFPNFQLYLQEKCVWNLVYVYPWG